MSKKKKIVLLSVMIGMLVVSGVLNYIVGDNSINVGNKEDSMSVSAMFSAYRTDIEQTRSQMILELQAIIDSPNTSETAKTSAENLLLATCENMETESILEALIMAKGFENAIVSVSGSGIDVIVDSPQLDTAQLAQILSLVIEKTGVSASAVHVQPYGENL